jgi:hypothetical protein
MIASIFFIFFPRYHSTALLFGCANSRPFSTGDASRGIRQTEIYKTPNLQGFVWGIKNLMPFKNSRHPCCLLTSRQKFRQLRMGNPDEPSGE